MRNFFRFTVVVLFALIALNVNAQSAGDRLFAQGQKYQMTQTEKSQNLAIAKFRSASKAYDSATKKAMCNNQITICQNNIKTIRAKAANGGKRHKEKVKKTEEVEEKESQQADPEREPVKLSLSVSSVEFKAAGKKNDNHEVTVNCNYDDWTYTLPDWVQAIKNGNRLLLTASPNDTESERSGTLTVTCDDTKAELMIYQKSKFSIKSIFGGKKNKK